MLRAKNVTDYSVLFFFFVFLVTFLEADGFIQAHFFPKRVVSLNSAAFASHTCTHAHSLHACPLSPVGSVTQAYKEDPINL